ncbi:MAG: hypothetical protein JXQ27_12090 [Acidobacteria bacterium]|nr:hypothetical protein [Acidobacteriota bacterium]
MATTNPLLQAIKSGVAPDMVKIAAAKGSLPLPPETILEAQVMLADDKNAKVRGEALASIQKYSSDELCDILERRNIAPEVLHFCAVQFTSKTAVVEKILLHSATSPRTISKIAPICSQSLAELIIANQVRLIENPEIIASLRRNTNLTARNLKTLDEIEEHFLTETPAEIPERITADETAAIAGPDRETVAENEAGNDEDMTRILPTEPSSAQLEHILQMAEDDPDKLTLYQKMASLPVSEKIKLALLGRREERTLLIKDANKMVALSVLHSPKINESEIETYSQLRNVSDEVLRVIGRNREWTRNHKIALNLVKNPKTPVQISTSLINRLTMMDCKLLVKDRSIPEVIRRQAKRLLERRK